MHAHYAMTIAPTLAAVHFLVVQWRMAALIGGVLLATGIVVRPKGSVRSFVGPALREAGFVFALFALWQVVRIHTAPHNGKAMANGKRIWDIQHDVHLPSEVWVQHRMLGHPWLVHATNYYYAYAHFTFMTVFLCWLWLRHHDRYHFWRTAIVLTTGFCILIQTIPVAPPRFFAELGFVDTALQYGESVYGPHPTGFADQISAMPSVHVAWAVTIAVTVMCVSPSRWRWLGPLHAVLTVWAVVATANHWWSDGIVAAVLLALSLALQRLALAAWRRWRQPPNGPAPQSAPADVIAREPA